MNKDVIAVNGAKIHNLKNISLKIPKNAITVITGPSGSGKSSLAFDTLYVEGQRRYIESLSSYARQFLGMMAPPDVESITGLSPAIAIDQKTISKNPRSTVGTVTEVYDYIRLLFARTGELYSPETGELVESHSASDIVSFAMDQVSGSKLQVLAPLKMHDKKRWAQEVTKFIASGVNRFYQNGEILKIENTKELKYLEKTAAILDRVIIKKESRKRIYDSVEYALKISNGLCALLINEKHFTFSSFNKAPSSDTIFPELSPQLFSFNSPLGACSECKGIGISKRFDLDEIILDESIPLLEGAIPIIFKKNSFFTKMLETVALSKKIDLTKAMKSLPKSFINILFYGDKKKYSYKFTTENSKFEFSKEFPGLIPWLEKKYKETGSERVRIQLESSMKIKECPECEGKRLNPIALSTKVADLTIDELCNMPLEKAYTTVKSLKLDGEKKIIAKKVLHEITSRISFLNDVGLKYLSLNRSSATLSGGEAQRIRLATQIGSALSGVIYVLDEPSIGLHQRDNSRLIKMIKGLKSLGNTVIVVEHDEETMMNADHLIDIGPGAGIHGGRIIAQGTPNEVLRHKKSITAEYLSGRKSIKAPKVYRNPSGSISLKGATHNNLKGVDLQLPLGVLSCITGVSGSGKSTLIHSVLVPAIKSSLSRKAASTFAKKNYLSLTGDTDKLRSLIKLDQSPIGRSPHSNPATYTGIFDDIRKIFAKTPDAQIRGYKQGRFSFNVKGGRCDDCEGNGVKKIEMHFLPDVFVTCSTCQGTRYNEETLSIYYKGMNIDQVLKMTVSEAKQFFQNHPRPFRILSTMEKVGLGYLGLGQSATTLSGGEAQRLKLSKELAKKTKGHCLYILDEPTTGLHFEDIRLLLSALQELVDQGHTMAVIEHNLDIIKSSDHVIDLGPEGGDEGGIIIASGNPREVSKTKTETAKFLRKALK